MVSPSNFTIKTCRIYVFINQSFHNFDDLQGQKLKMYNILRNSNWTWGSFWVIHGNLSMVTQIKTLTARNHVFAFLYLYLVNIGSGIMLSLHHSNHLKKKIQKLIWKIVHGFNFRDFICNTRDSSWVRLQIF